MHDKVKRPQSVSKIKISVNTPLVFSSVDLSYSCFQNNTCPELWKSRRRSRTIGVVCWLTLPLFGATSLVKKPFCDSNGRARQFTLGTVQCSQWASCFCHLRVTVLPGSLACTSVTILSLRPESFECAHALVYKVKRVCFNTILGWVCCWFSALLQDVFLQVPCFFPLLKI